MVLHLVFLVGKRLRFLVERETKICIAGVRSRAQPSLQHALKPFARTFASACAIERDSMLPLFWRAGKCI